jgi:O-antigen/teichoic acid export membrane protein
MGLPLKALDPRLSMVLATAAASYVGRFGMGLVVLLTVPMARGTLAPDLFGVWMMLTALLGFFAFADLGIGNGVLNGVTQAMANNDRLQIRRLLGSGYLCTVALGLAVFSLWAVWTFCAARPVAVAGLIGKQHEAEVLRALHVFAFFLALNIPASLAQKAQLGSQQGYWIGFAQFVSAVGALVAVPWVLHRHGELYELVLATLGIQTLVNVCSTIWWLRRQAIFAGARWVEMQNGATTWALLRTGVYFFSLQLAAAFAFQSDAIVITQQLGQTIYGDFAVVQKLFLFLSMVLSSALLGLWPAFGDAIAKNDMGWMKNVLLRSLVAAGSFSTLAAVGLILSMDWITTHWLHTATPPGYGLLWALATWTILEALGTVCGMFLNGANAIRIQVVFALAMASLAFGGKWLLTPVVGPTGAVLATIAAYLLISVPGQIYIIRRLVSVQNQA